MTYFEDIKNVYKKSIVDTISIIKKVPYSIFSVLIYSILLTILNGFFYRLQVNRSFIWGFVEPIIYALLLSSLFYGLYTLVTYKRIYFQDFQKSFIVYAVNIYSFLFVMYLIGILSKGFLMLSPVFILALEFIFHILINASPESIYLKGMNGLKAIMNSIDYLKDNWHIWLLQLIIYLFLKAAFDYYLFGNFQLRIDAWEYFIKDMSIPFIFGKYILALIFDGIYIIFRGVLFRNTMDSTKRKREFQGMFYEYENFKN